MVRAGSVFGGVAAWIVGAVAAVGVGIAALSLIGPGLTDTAGTGLTGTGNQPDPAVTGLDATTPPPSGDPTSTVTPTGASRTIESAGGTVVARCGEGGAYLLSWSPAPGYRTDEVSRGPAPIVRVSFEGNGREIKITIDCVGGIPHPTIRTDH